MILKNKTFLKLLNKLKEDGYSEMEKPALISMSAKHKKYFLSIYVECSPNEYPTINDLYINELYYEKGNDFKVFDLLPFQFEYCLKIIQNLYDKIINDKEIEETNHKNWIKEMENEQKANF